MHIIIKSDPLRNQIATMTLSWQEVEQLVDGKQIESQFTNPKFFIKIDDNKVSGLSAGSVITDELVKWPLRS